MDPRNQPRDQLKFNFFTPFQFLDIFKSNSEYKSHTKLKPIFPSLFQIKKRIFKPNITQAINPGDQLDFQNHKTFPLYIRY